MARSMPPLATHFGVRVATAVGIAQAGELVRAGARPGTTAYTELRPARLEALYEMAYLRIFVEWESFLEETFLRLMCSYELPWHTPLHMRSPLATIDDA